MPKKSRQNRREELELQTPVAPAPEPILIQKKKQSEIENTTAIKPNESSPFIPTTDTHENIEVLTSQSPSDTGNVQNKTKSIIKHKEPKKYKNEAIERKGDSSKKLVSTTSTAPEPELPGFSPSLTNYYCYSYNASVSTLGGSRNSIHIPKSTSTMLSTGGGGVNGNSNGGPPHSTFNPMIMLLGKISDESLPQAYNHDLEFNNFNIFKNNAAGQFANQNTYTKCTEEVQEPMKQITEGLTAPEINRQNFHCFLKESGLLGALSTVILGLYDEESDKLPAPENVADHIASVLGYKYTVHDEIDRKKLFNSGLQAKILEMEEENDLLRRQLDQYESTETPIQAMDPDDFSKFKPKVVEKISQQRSRSKLKKPEPEPEPKPTPEPTLTATANILLKRRPHRPKARPPRLPKKAFPFPELVSLSMSEKEWGGSEFFVPDNLSSMSEAIITIDTLGETFANGVRDFESLYFSWTISNANTANSKVTNKS